MKKANRSKSAKKTELSIAPTDTDAGLLWLEGLGEPKFRDSVLLELFRKMRERGEIEWFENIHGRLDKGVDYILLIQTALERKVLGIQVKGKPITRAGGNGSLSALQVAGECEAAMKHDFQVQGSKRRLDSIAVWSSAHVTPDAEEEFLKPGLTYHIQIKKPREIFSLIEQFAPAQLGNVPQLALVKYIKEQSEPESEAVRVFGCPINPKIHFLEPELSEHAPGSSGSMKNVDGHLRPKKSTASLVKIFDDHRHTTLFAAELSGKSYLLKRFRTVFAERRQLSILLDASKLAAIPRSAAHLVAGALKFLSPHEVESFSQGSSIVLLIDDLDRVPQPVRDWMFSLDPKRFRVIGAGRSILVPTSVATLYITGTKLGSLPKFLRSLNLQHSKSFLDRAQSFIERTLEASRLPKNAFTISIMLQECQHGGSKFSTPTMGRLIERFVELQLGSHSEDNFVVDFETKRDFLSHLAGKPASTVSISDFRRKLAAFIEFSKHPQTIEDFISDFRKSGVFIFGENDVKWAHPAFKEYFWVRNLVSNGKLGPIAKALCQRLNPTLAALAGSQTNVKDIPALVQVLIDEVSRTPLPTLQSLVPEIQGNSMSSLISDEEEEALLNDLEFSDQKDSSKIKHPLARIAKTSLFGDREDDEEEKPAEVEDSPQMDEETKVLLRKRIGTWMEEISQTRLEFAYNLASVLMNARKAKSEWKQKGLSAVIHKSREFGNLLNRFFVVVFPERKDLAFQAGWTSFLSTLHIADRMIGDPFLVNVLRGMKKTAKSNEERLQLLDLLLCCGEDVSEELVKVLREVNRLDVTFAVYVRIVGIYYFRYHRDIDRTTLRNLLKNIRLEHKTHILPKI